jgi:hypothetical protein
MSERCVIVGQDVLTYSNGVSRTEMVAVLINVSRLGARAASDQNSVHDA